MIGPCKLVIHSLKLGVRTQKTQLANFIGGVSTPLKNMLLEFENPPQVGVKTKSLKPPPTYYGVHGSDCK